MIESFLERHGQGLLFGIISLYLSFILCFETGFMYLTCQNFLFLPGGGEGSEGAQKTDEYMAYF